MKSYPADKCFVCGVEFEDQEYTRCSRVECAKEYYVGDDFLYFHIIRQDKYYQVWLGDSGVEIYRNDFPKTNIVYKDDMVPQMTYQQWQDLIERVESLSAFK